LRNKGGRRAGLGDGYAALPDYSVRVSARACRVRLVMTVDRGLEIVVPRGFDRRQIPGLVETKRAWIERAGARVESHRARLEAEPPQLPGRIALQALGEEWKVEYRPRPVAATMATRSAVAGEKVRVAAAVAREHPGHRLMVTGNPEDSAACGEALRRWLGRKAREALVPRLEEVAREQGLKYCRVSIRQQRTRWASCSRRGTISLNARLLFLPPAVVDYVLLHELCHIIEMNHSPRFWTLLGYHDPQCRAHRKVLKRAGESIPTWVDYEVEGSEV
jgi:predicted metal-dependent hydrolase